MIRIRGRSFLKKFICNKVAGFRVSILLKVNFARFTFQKSFQLFKNAYFKEFVLIAASAIYLLILFLLSGKQVRKSIGLLLKSKMFYQQPLPLSWRRPLSYRNQSIDLLCKSMDWFLYDNGLRPERVKLFVRSHHDHGHIIYDQAQKFLFIRK